MGLLMRGKAREGLDGGAMEEGRGMFELGRDIVLVRMDFLISKIDDIYLLTVLGE